MMSYLSTYRRRGKSQELVQKQKCARTYVCEGWNHGLVGETRGKLLGLGTLIRCVPCHEIGLRTVDSCLGRFGIDGEGKMSLEWAGSYSP